jgi:hypothetical protein
LADTYQELNAPVHQFIEARPLAKERLHLNFEVSIFDAGFENSLFDFILGRIRGLFWPGYWAWIGRKPSLPLGWV